MTDSAKSDRETQEGGNSHRCGVVALLGAPNAGKSTLLNGLVGAKISIVTHKVQTTRARIRGIAMEGDSQIVLVDTPGIFAAERRLERAMVAAAWAGARDADSIVLIYDASRKRIDKDTRMIIDGLKETNRRAVLVLNKIDAIKRERLLELIALFNAEGIFDETFMISALKGDGVKDLMSYLAASVPSGEWLFPDDQLSDLPMRLLAAEVTREKLFLHLHQELPYALTVETESWEDFQDGSARLEQTIYVQRDQHKSICLGKKGQMIRRIREEAQAELQEMTGRKIHLFLFVKVRERWVDDPERYREWGLEFNA
ncbi:GTPase Era [Denitrobaculum tricleocarpae]|uniref:GTPase Era n=1 Tax=Denitrobaculum tricleocarpae TaxID=2591009 RepID=A0A545TTR7_9PROT|nr:GTPase Era [Denitrobaculum tricleocarpae]TQV80604.1 GTPase Era [Denitrobaculum tricleocarpae]